MLWILTIVRHDLGMRLMRLTIFATIGMMLTGLPATGAVVYDVIDLGTLGGEESWVLSIDESGQVVGGARIPSGYHRVAVFDPTGGNDIDPSSLINQDAGWTLTSANWIDYYGWIAGNGIDPQGCEHTFLLIPEPATLSLLGLGALILCKRR